MWGFFGWLRRRPKFETPEYSVEIQTAFREGRWIIYREKDRIVSFSAEAVGRKWEQLNAMPPAGLQGADLERVVANVTKGLEQLGHDYVIWQVGDKLVVPEAEQAEARNRLREMGFEASAPEAASDASSRQVKLTRRSGAPKRTVGPGDSVEIAKAVMAVRGVRYTRKILAQSKRANTEFL